MGGRLAEVLVGAVVAAAVWCWLQYGPWAGVRYQRSAAWLRPSAMRRVLRAARRKERALEREIRRFLRKAAPQRPDRASRRAPGTKR
jgi:hypothetical protein